MTATQRFEKNLNFQKVLRYNKIIFFKYTYFVSMTAMQRNVHKNRFQMTCIEYVPWKSSQISIFNRKVLGLLLQTPISLTTNQQIVYINPMFFESLKSVDPFSQNVANDDIQK